MNNNVDELNSEVEQSWYTKAEVAALLDVSPSTVYHYYKQGKIRRVEDPHRLHKEARYYKKEVNEILENTYTPQGYKTSEIAEKLNISVQMIYKFIKDGFIEAESIPYGDERTNYIISEESLEKLEKLLENMEPSKPRKSEYYDEENNIALFQKFQSTTTGNARVIKRKGTKNEFAFCLLADEKIIDYQTGIHEYELQPTYTLHQEVLDGKGYSTLIIPKNQSILYPLIDYLYSSWGIENFSLREKEENVEIFLSVGEQPFINVDFSLRDVTPFIKKGTWTLKESKLIIERSYRKTSFDLPTEMIEQIKDIALKQHITMSKCVENLLKESLTNELIQKNSTL